MKRNINTRASAFATLAMLALCSTLLAQEPAKPQPRPAEPKPKEEGVLRGGGGGEKPAPAPNAKPAGKDPVSPRGEGVPVIKGDKKDPGEPGIKGAGTPKGDKKDPGEPGVVKGEPVKTGDKKDPGEPGVKEGADPKGEMKKPSGARSVDVPAVIKPAESEKSAVEPAAKPIAPDFEASAKRKYDSLDHKDVSFEEFFGFEKMEADRLQKLKDNPGSRFRLIGVQPRAVTPCQNGDFEPSGLQVGAWGFGYGTVLPNTGVVDYQNFTAAQSSGIITSASARQTTTNTGVDPNVGIQMTGPDVATGQPSAHAVRIGNAVKGAGAELISKTFTVTSAESNIRFWYAAVFQDPGHPPHQQPAFTVRVLVGGAEVQGLVDLGNGTGKIVADSKNPFFKTKSGGLVYKDWSCAQINLKSQIGKIVTIQFVTQDCSQTGHWGYAYIDNVCGKCTNNPTGDIQFDKAKSSTCGKGNICFTYALPKNGNAIGTGVIALSIYQAGNPTPVKTLTSPTLSAGTSYCFPIDPAALPLNVALGGFDFSATGTFTLGTEITKLTDDGGVQGNNNDYKISCGNGVGEVKSDDCCAGANLVPNGGMDVNGEKPRSGYEEITLSGRSPLLPGSFTLIDVAGLQKACPNWQLPAACKATKDFSGGVMLVNGLTNQAAGKTGVILDQKLSLPKPDKGEEAEYKICFRYLPLPTCCFDVVPKLKVVVTKGGGAPVTLMNVSDVPTGCGHLFSANFKAPQGAANLQILLAEDDKGDGNDLMIDNVSIRQLVGVPGTAMQFGYAPSGSGATFQITTTATAALTNPPYDWVWELWDPATPNAPLKTVSGNVNPAVFGGLNETNQYIFKLKAWSSCNRVTGSMLTWAPAARKAQQQSVEDPNPEPVKAGK